MMRDSLRLNKSLFIVLASTLLLGAICLAPGPVGAAPYPGPNPYPYAKSTYWAWQNRPDLPANLGQAKDWATNAASQGRPVNQYPRKGDIVVFQPGVYGATAEGHVAVVEQVLEDGQYVASEMSESDCMYDSSTCGRVNRRTFSLVKGTAFIHYLKDTRTTWGFASGAAGWTASDLGEGNMGGPGWYYPIAGADPQLVSPELEVPLESYSGIEVTMVTGAPVSDPTVQVYFATTNQPTFIEAQSAKVKAQADGVLHTYRFDFVGNPSWKGTLSHLRFDPAGAGKSGGVRIDRVRLLSIQDAPTGPGAYNALITLAGHRPGR